MCFRHLGKGDLFGEDISRRTPAKRANGDVRALTYCDVYFITRDRLQNVLHFYQDFAFKFSENLELTYDLGASEVMVDKMCRSKTKRELIARSFVCLILK